MSMHPIETKEKLFTAEEILNAANPKFRIEPKLMQDIQAQLRDVVQNARASRDGHRFYLQSILKDKNFQPLCDELLASIMQGMQALDLKYSSDDFSAALDKAISEGIGQYEKRNPGTTISQPEGLTHDLKTRIKSENFNKKSILDKLYEAYCEQYKSVHATCLQLTNSEELYDSDQFSGCIVRKSKIEQVLRENLKINALKVRGDLGVCIDLAEILKGNRLSSLEIECMQSAECFVSLKDAITRNQSLMSLHLHGCPQTSSVMGNHHLLSPIEEGIKFLAALLIDNKTLQALTIENWNFTSVACNVGNDVAFANAFKENNTLRSLSLRGCTTIGRNGSIAGALIQTFRKDRLHSLDLSGSDLFKRCQLYQGEPSVDYFPEFFSAFSQMKNLQRLNLSGCALFDTPSPVWVPDTRDTPDRFNALLEFLKANSTLKFIDLSGNPPITLDQQQQLLDAVESNANSIGIKMDPPAVDMSSYVQELHEHVRRREALQQRLEKVNLMNTFQDFAAFTPLFGLRPLRSLCSEYATTDINLLPTTVPARLT